jgi:hypothetical protein
MALRDHPPIWEVRVGESGTAYMGICASDADEIFRSCVGNSADRVGLGADKTVVLYRDGHSVAEYLPPVPVDRWLEEQPTAAEATTRLLDEIERRPSVPLHLKILAEYIRSTR